MRGLAPPHALVSEQSDILVAENVSKRFGSTQALDGVSVSFRTGEVHALMGENGAGKSTLGKCIAGLHAPDSGAITLDGDALTPGSIDAAFAAGVRIVHQELAQCPNLSVAENLCLHHLPTRGLRVDRRAMERRAASLVHSLDVGIDVRAPLGSLPPGRRQICQIAAALDDRSDDGGSAPKVIVFDEPTSSLSIAETQRLHRIIGHLRGEGLTIIYVSHRMGEIFDCCDRVTVLRDGRFVATSTVAEIDEPTLVEQMIGRRVETSAGARSPGGEALALRALADGGEEWTLADAKPMLRVNSLSSPGRLDAVSLTVKAGEVVGIGGLVGAGRSELLDAIFGLDPAAGGEVIVGMQPVPPRSPRAMIRLGVGYVPEDRRLQGLFFQLGIGENIVVPSMPELGGPGRRDFAAERELIGARMETFQIKASGVRATPDELSGGNQQKLLIARWMGPDAKVLLLDEPTRGIDVGTKAEIYKAIRAAAARGAAVLFVSSEMPELLALADRLLVMCAGRITGELVGAEMTQTNILTLATHEPARRF